MDELKEILNKVKDAEATIALDAEDVDPRVRAGVEANIQNAKVDIGILEKQYMDAVMKHVLVFNVSGPFAKDFASKAEAAGLLHHDYNEVIEILIERLQARNAPTPYDTNTHFMLIDELSKLRREYSMLTLPTPMVNAGVDAVYNEELPTALRNLIKKNYGESLNSAIVRRKIGKSAYDLRFKGKKIGIILTNNNGSVDTTMLPSPILTFEANTEMTDEEVVEKIKEVRGFFKKEKKENTEQ